MKRIGLLILCVLLLLSSASCMVGEKHDFDPAWSHDEMNHWHVCLDKDCVEISDGGAHNWVLAEVIKEPSQGSLGESRMQCSVCGLEIHVMTEPLYIGVPEEEWVTAVKLADEKIQYKQTVYDVKNDVLYFKDTVTVSGNDVHLLRDSVNSDSGDAIQLEAYFTEEDGRYTLYERMEDGTFQKEECQKWAYDDATTGLYGYDEVRGLSEFLHYESFELKIEQNRVRYVCEEFFFDGPLADYTLSDIVVIFSGTKLQEISYRIEFDGLIYSVNQTFFYEDVDVIPPSDS